jgi:hypothetical protein
MKGRRTIHVCVEIAMTGTADEAIIYKDQSQEVFQHCVGLELSWY